MAGGFAGRAESFTAAGSRLPASAGATNHNDITAPTIHRIVIAHPIRKQPANPRKSFVSGTP